MLTESDVAYLPLIYEAKTFLADDLVVGGMIDILRTTGMYDRTLLIVTSDHGEALADHGSFGHQSVFQEVLNIPLVVKFPRGGKPPGLSRQVNGITRTIDLLPSLLSYFEIDPKDDLPGIDIFGSQTKDIALAQSILAFPENEPAHWKARSARSSQFKLREFEEDYELYDLSRDAGETEDVSDAYPEQVAALRAALDPLRKSEESALVEETAPVPEVDPETARWLRAMGYIE